MGSFLLPLIILCASTSRWRRSSLPSSLAEKICQDLSFQSFGALLSRSCRRLARRRIRKEIRAAFPPPPSLSLSKSDLFFPSPLGPLPPCHFPGSCIKRLLFFFPPNAGSLSPPTHFFLHRRLLSPLRPCQINFCWSMPGAFHFLREIPPFLRCATFPD